jgi:N-acetylglucosaminyldiphosphoundecaprenol N-acetyl-beta-D-mannosaminyltransferase
MKLLNYSFFQGSMKELLTKILSAVKTKENCFIITPNPEFLGFALTEDKMDKVLKKATILIPDGSSILLLIKLLKKVRLNRLTGIDTVNAILESGANLKIYMLGSSEENIEIAAQNISNKFPNLNIAGYSSGYFDLNTSSTIIRDINTAKPDILIVGMGMPRQEYFVYDNLEKIDVPVKICVGGTFDVIAGKLSRSPVWMQNFGLEWAYRLLKEPYRISRIIKIPYYLYKIYFMERKYYAQK